MPTRVLRSEDDIDKLSRFIAARTKYPMTVTITTGAGRGPKQNRLAQRWFTDIAVQLGDRTHEDVRAECKLQYGVPILRAENEAFRQSYDRTMKHLPYEAKLDAIKAFDMPVTRLMTVKQMIAFMGEMERTWTQRGVRLTHPDDLKYQEEFS